MTRVLVAIESPILRKGLETVLAASPNLEVIESEVAGPIDWKERLGELQPDIVVAEARGEDDAATSFPEFESEEHPVAVVLLADHPAVPWVREVLRGGVRGVLPREATGEEVVTAVEAVARGYIVLPPRNLDSLLPGAPTYGPDTSLTPVRPLSPREMEVLQSLAEGLGNKEIAWKLGISEHTVKFHINSIFTKLNASSRTEAVSIGFRQGLILI